MLPCEGWETRMAITIRNKETERIIRDVGSQTGEGPSALIARLVGQEERRLAEARKARREERRKALDALMAATPKATPEDWEDIQRIMDDMYDAGGLPK